MQAYASALEQSQRKEQFSRAFVHAVASVAGFTMTTPSVDTESVDVIFTGDGAASFVPPRLEAQLKCTSREVLKQHHLAFPLKIKNYNDLRATPLLVPRILIVVCVPKLTSSWLDHRTELRTVLKHSGYWLCLRGCASSGNTDTVTVPIPRKNRFTPTSLTEIMGRIARREDV